MVVTHKMATKSKHQEVTLKVKYEALKENGRQNKDVAKQYGIPGSGDRRISAIVFWWDS